MNPILRIKVNCNTESQETADLVNDLLTITKNASIIKGGIIIDPLLNEHNEYIVPSIIDNKKYTLLIDVTESGGWDGPDEPNTAQIVCGMSGKALKPYFIPRLNVKECGDHAFFSIPEGCVLVQVEGDIVTIIEVKIQLYQEEGLVSLVEKEYYHGHVDDLPTDLIRFKMPSQIAVDKSNCEKCTHVHYYVDTNQIITKTNRRN